MKDPCDVDGGGDDDRAHSAHQNRELAGRVDEEVGELRPTQPRHHGERGSVEDIRDRDSRHHRNVEGDTIDTDDSRAGQPTEDQIVHVLKSLERESFASDVLAEVKEAVDLSQPHPEMREEGLRDHRAHPQEKGPERLCNEK